MPRCPGAVAGFIALALAASNSVAEARPGSILPVQNTASIEDSRALIDEYCVTCHNQRTLMASLALDTMDLNDIPSGAEVWEKVIRKLRIGMMPPDGARRPDVGDAQALVSMLEASLDQAAAQDPNPGRRLIHRMNRAEYANAIRDLLDLEVDTESLLPPDDSAYGFDCSP